ncbi:MAG: hypothetical protein IJ819_00275 [Clostridiales bacterium]|nr:hypothetical protein [Clostridiales bacterium]
MTKEEALKPIVRKGKYPTKDASIPHLGYLNSLYCPVCGKLFTSFYDADNLPNRSDGYRFNISKEWNYCSRCGQRIDFSDYQHERDLKTADDEVQLD